MDFLDFLMSRRSVRKFRDEPVSKEMLSLILQAGLTSPSSKNTRPVEFITIHSRDTLEKLSRLRGPASAFLSNAACAIAVLSDKDKTDLSPENSSIALYGMQLCAHSLGLGSCWVHFRLRSGPDGRTAEECAREFLHFPENYELEAVLALGYPEHPYRSHTPEEFDPAKVHSEQF